MATLFDASLLAVFDIVFAFLFVLVFTFAVFHKYKVVSASTAINSIIGVVVALLVIISDTLVQIINFMLPWFIVVIIFAVLMIMVFQVLGAKDADFSAAIKDKLLMWIVIGVCVVILGAAIFSVIPDNVAPYLDGNGDVDTATGDGSTSSGSFSNNLLGIVFNPKVIGIAVIFLVAVFAIALLSGKP